MTYDPDLIDRLAREARSAIEAYRRDPWRRSDPVVIAESYARLTAMADQLEAARREVERLSRLQSTTVRIAMEEAGVSGERRVNLQQANLALLAERDLMAPVVTAVERWRNVCDPNGWSRESENLSDEGEAVLAAIDAYRAAKGKP